MRKALCQAIEGVRGYQAYIEEWLDEQDIETVAGVFSALELLEGEGPSLGRPLVDTLEGSYYKNMKELRPVSPGESEIRIIFIFDPRRAAILLLAGDKSKGSSNKKKWSRWYRTAIAKAEVIYREHLRGLEGSYDR